ncbi:MAG: DUF3800 domain-containing protein [Nostoc sp. NMS7]|uniref:DUF3800 domain-containing protein n=1 Tax=Nostoc sp. NMS7 TaxID=2815391 RepID=UPI0025D4F52B|nr:DUF3800 domain-containing protein [Nostoc sp. NMS7]MBN3946405.1 DUF3800 domain-containing protein [Nostoc sp. NMS7]
MQQFALYLDESGSQKPSPHDQALFFAMGGVIIKRGDESIIESSLNGFKTRWEINLDTPLHSTEMRSKVNKFRFLKSLSPERFNDFYSDLHSVIASCPIVIHACVVSRNGYISRYQEMYGLNTWEMMKSSFYILIERSVKYAQKQEAKLMVYYEEAGKVEDRKLKSFFKEIRSNGLPFNQSTSQRYNPCTAEGLSKILSGIEGKKKANPVMQIADYCLHPIADVKLHPTNRAYHAFKTSNLIVDCIINPEEIGEIGVKYYCY